MQNLNVGRSKVQASQPAIQRSPNNHSPVDRNGDNPLRSADDANQAAGNSLTEDQTKTFDAHDDEKSRVAQINQMVQFVYRKDDSALGELGLDNLNLDNSKTRIEGQGQEADNQGKVVELKDDIIQDRNKDDINNDFTDEERARLMKALNLINQPETVPNHVHERKEVHVGGHTNVVENIQPIEGAHFYFPKMNKKFVIYDRKSCYLFSSEGCFRRKIVWLSCWPWFDNFIITLILVNSIMLALFDYQDRDALTDHNQMIEQLGFIFTLIFTVECIIKVIAMGFFMHRNSYLRDYWNWLDFIVVCIGVFENIPGIPKLKALRTMRVLRPLRSVNAFPQMRRLIGSLLASIPELGNAVVFMFFIFLLFGIMGVQSFKGTLYQRCRVDPMPSFKIGDVNETSKMWYWDKAEDVDRLCSLTSSEGNYMCPNSYTCGSPTHNNALTPNTLLHNFTAPLMLTEGSQDDELIAYDIANFNTLPWAMVTIFVMITLEGWSGLMYNLSDASMSWMAILFCILLVVVGSFFLLNVILAVIMESFQKVDNMQGQIEMHKKMQLKAQKQACGIYDSSSDSDLELINDNLSEKSKDDDRPVNLNPNKPGLNRIADESNLEKTKVEGQKEIVDSQIEMVQQTSKVQGSQDLFDQTQNIKKDNNIQVDHSIEHLLKSGDDSQTQKLLKDSQKDQNNNDEILKIKNDDDTLAAERANRIKNKQIKKDQLKQMQKDEQKDQENEDMPERVQNNKFYLFFYTICMHDLFTISMTAAILLNTLVLAFDQYPISYDVQTYLDFINQVLSYIFIAEMVVKLLGMGIREYCSDNFNIFDGTVVIISIVEMIVSRFIEGGLGGGAISSLRAVRLLRVFKLARSWTSFRDLLAKMIVTLKDIQYFACLLVLFMFIFTLLGMELFAYRVRFNNEDKEKPIDGEGVEDPYYPRASFNTPGLGFTTIFIVFIGEDWNSVMYDHTRSQGVACILIFMVIFIVGNLIMLNLFLAILLQNFEEPPGKEEEQVETGPSSFTLFKQMISKKLSMCCSCCCPQSEKQVQDIGQLTEQMNDDGGEHNDQKFGKDRHSKAQTPKAKNSMMGMSDKDFSQRGQISLNEREDGQDNDQLSPHKSINSKLQDDQSFQGKFNDFKAQTEVKNLQYQDGSEIDNEDVSGKKDENQNKLKGNLKLDKKKGYASNMSEQKRVTIDIQDAIKSPSKTRKFLRQKTMEISEKSSNTQKFSISAIKQMEVEAAEKPKRKPLTVTGRSLWLMSPENPIRKCSVNIVGQEDFDNVILFLIVFSTFMLVLESPLNDPKSKMADNLFYIDIVVTALFTMELVLKVIVLGFLLNGKDSYIRNPWNIMDFMIVAFSLISISFRDAGSSVSAIKTFRMLRVLRPLRMISRNQGLKIAVNSLINSVPYIRDVIVVSFLFLLLFAILCVNFYKGTFYTCQVSSDILDSLPEYVAEQLQSNLDEKVENKFQCLDYGGEWVNTDSNFDNSFDAMITLFNVMTTEGWIDVMWTAVDASNIDYVPVKQDFSPAVIFFLFIVFFFHLFILNMFVGIVINVFSDEKKTLELNHLLTQTQLDWCEVLIFCYKSEPDVKFLTTGNMIKDTCYSIAINTYFDRFILFCIILNTGCLMTTYHGEPPNLQDILAEFNLIFNIIYTIEAIVKLIAFDKDYFKDGWNKFDFIIVMAAWFGFISSKIDGLEIGQLTNVIRIFRIFRIFKIIKKVKSLRILFYTFIGAIPQLTNVGSLLALFLFLYSVLGVEWFAVVKLQENLTIHANFRTFLAALSTLFRMATGESWQAIMYDCARKRSIMFECVSKPEYADMFNKETKELEIEGCGDPVLAYVYFLSFMLTVSFIFLNLFIAIILESFASSMDEEGLQIGESTINKFKDFWSESKFDPKGSKFINIVEFPDFLCLIIDEEIRQDIQYDHKLKNGEIALEDQVGTKIFMFNIFIHLMNQQPCIYEERRQMILQKMIENEEIDEDTQLDEVPVQCEIEKSVNEKENKDQELTLAAQQEGGARDDIEQERLRRKKIDQQIKQKQHEQKLKNYLDNFIGTMEMPCYDKCKTFYYYDVLEALSRHLFQTIINQQKKQLEDELMSDSSSDNSSEKDMDNDSNQDSENGRRERKDTETTINENEKVLTERELEDREDILLGSLPEILRKLEDKGSEQPDIEKYKEMRLWRQKRDKTVREQLEQFNHIGNKRSIIDSSQLVGARVILKYLKRYHAKKKKLAQQSQSNQSKDQNNTTDTDNIEARRQARIKEIEIQRKKKKVSNKSQEEESKQNMANKSMPQIKEAANEDKDYSSDKKIQNFRRSQDEVRRGTKIPGHYDNHEGDAAYSTFQKDSEPGNRQGNEAPFINQFYSPQSYNGNGSEDQTTQQVQIISNKTPTNAAKKGSVVIEGMDSDEYHQQEASDMQDILSASNSNVKNVTQSQPNAGD